jgi:hypothetical protein
LENQKNGDVRTAILREMSLSKGPRAKAFLDRMDESVQAHGLKNETVNMMENGPRMMRGNSRRYRGDSPESSSFGGIRFRCDVYDGEKSDGIAETTIRRHRHRWRFDRKAEIEECAAPSAVNFRVLSSRPGQGGFAFVRGVLESLLWSTLRQI